MNHLLSFLRGILEFKKEEHWADPLRMGHPTTREICYEWGRDFMRRILKERT